MKNIVTGNQIWKTNLEKTAFRFSMIFMAAIPFLTGLYFEYFSCLITLVLSVFLFYFKRKAGSLSFRLNDASMAIITLVLFYGISIAFSSDKGIAVWGVFKFFPLIPFLLLLFQLSRKERLQLLGQIPFIASIMTVLSCLLIMIPFFRNYILVNGRMGGFFQYPNTFAMYLLIGLIVLYAGEVSYPGQWKKVLTGILLCGILLSGSRTVAGLTMLAGISLAVWSWRKQKSISVSKEEKEVKRHSGRMFVLLGMILLAGLAVLSGIRLNLFGSDLLGRFSMSTFWGRLLYFQDAFGQIIRHPFGLGYMGYYLTQGEFQRGVYSVMYVHNDWLQILLDVGWIPAVFMILAVLKALVSKEQSDVQKMILIFLGAHCMFDFDLQYLYMFFLLLMTFDLETEKTYRLYSGIFPVLAVMAAGGLYIGLANFVYYMGDMKFACELYSLNTFAELRLLMDTQNVDELEQIADHLLARNEKLSLAWNAKAKAAYARGDFETVISAKRKAISLAKYDISTYEDYFEMLSSGVDLYEAAGYEESADMCREEIRNLQVMLDETEKQTSPLAWKTVDKPELELSEQYKDYVSCMN